MKYKYPRLLVVLSALILSIGSLWAVPARPGWQTKAQPDGTPIAVQLMGDEFYHYWKTQDGKIAKEQEDGTFVVTDEDVPTGEQVAMRRAASKRAPRNAKMIGAGFMPPRALFILVSFSNQTFKSTSEDYYKSKLGDKTDGAMSMYNYLKQQSNGQYAPSVDVYGPYTLSNTYATYGANDSNDDDQDPAQMIVDACKAADSEIDFSQYDGNNDGWVDNVYVLYAGKGEADGGAASTIWPHQWNITSGGKSLTVDGKKIGAYACSAELNGSSQCAMGTPLHEFGHVIGLPDYYDTEYKSTNYTESRTPGSWSIMDQGSYNNSGNTPPNYSIFDKYFLGWVTPKFLAKDEAANVTLTTDATDGYQITGGTSRVAATATSPATIYYIENRQKSGWDAYLPGHGMIVWQVKYNSSAWSNNNLNNTGGSPRYTLLSASGTATNIGKATDPFPGTGKVKTCTPVTGCAMTDITESSGIITFKYNGGIDCHNVVVEATGCTIEPSSTCVENSTKLTANITPTDGTYDFTSLTVKRGSTTLTKNTHYTLSSDNKSLTINASAITGSASDAITITAVWTKNRYSYAMLGENCTEELEGAVNKNAGLNLTIAPDAGYTLADAACWDVTMGGNKLTYGTGFTYSGTTFSIATVTGDVEIMAFGLHPVTWYAEGSVHATNVAVDGKVTLPATDPYDCESGKVFVGWCTSSNYSHASTAPTFAKDGDTYSVANYYAVYATAANSAPRRAKMAENSATYTFTSSSWAATEGNWTSGKAGAGYNNSGVQVTTGSTGANATCPSSYDNISSIVVSYCTNSSKGAGTIVMSVGSTQVSQSVSTSGGTSARDLTFDFSSTKPSGSPKITVNCTTNSIYVCGVTINYGDGGSYTDYSTSCGTPCSQTPTMSFANATVDKTTADANFTQTVTISGKGSGQTVAYSSSDETIATVNASGVVTLKGKVGSTTITASVEASGTYCAASASYTLNVTAAPINVTLYYNGTSSTLENQTNPCILPTTGDYVAAMCSGDWTFAGWCASTYAKSTNEPTYITQLNATGHAYAVYTTTETVSSAPARATAEEGGAVTITTTTANIPTGYGDANTFTEYTFEGYTFKVQQMYLNSGKLQWRASGHASGTGTMYNTQTFPGKITSIVLTYNSSDGNKNFTVNVGSSENPTSGTSITPSASGSVYTFDCSSANADYFVLANGTGAGYLDQIVINYGGSGDGGGTSSVTYYATTPECATPCSNTPVMSFTNASVALTTDDETYTQAVNISGKGSGQTVAYSSSNENIATVNASGVVTLKGVVGSTTITASVTADGDYCAASASYTLNVTAAPISVTLHYYYNDENHTANLNNQQSPYTLPTTGSYVADACDGDWTFDGWYGSEYAKSTTAPTYITQLNATGHAYAVYTTTETVSSAPARATAEEGGAVTITTTTANIPTGYGDANTFTEYTFEGYTFKVQQMYLNSGKLQWRASGHASGTGTMYNTQTFPGKITSIVLTYNSSDGNKNFTVNVGSSENPTSGTSITPSASGSVYTFDCSSANADYFVLANGTGAGYLDQIVINYGGSGGGGGSSSVTYYATTPECATPCSNTPVMSFTNASVALTTDDETYTQAVNISGKGSGQTVAYSSSNENIATVNASGVVTLKGVVGSTTITASVTADGDYCAASASYTLTVTAAPIDVTLHYNGGAATLSDQTPPYTLPTTSAYTVAMCDGDWTFAGWYGSEYAKSTTAPTYITQLNATGHAYAVYTTTETVSSAPARATAEEGGAVTITTTTANIPTGYGDANTFTEYTFEGYTFKVQQMYLNSGKLQWRASGHASGTGTMYNTQTFPGKITSIVLTYNSSDGNKNFTVNVGSSENPTSGTSITPSASGSVYTFDCSSANADYFVLANGTGAGYLDQIVINYGGSGGGGGSSSVTYYATTPECATPCSNTPVMSFTNASVALTTDDETYTQAVNISGKGSGQTVAYSSSNENIATVNASGVVTLKGVVGSTTITASVTADGDYCAASASYTITVEACALTGITLNTDNAKTVFLVGDQLTTAGVVVTANYSNCEDKIVKPDGFTYPGNITMEPGTKQVTAHYTEASATYDVTVVAPYTVTWKACGEVFDTQTYAPGTTLVLPTSTPGGNAGKSFVGWTATAHYTGASAPPDLFSAAGDKTVTGNVTYYAVYE